MLLLESAHRPAGSSTQRVLHCEEAHRVERVGLRLGDGRDVYGARQREEASEDALRILDDDMRVGPEEEQARHVQRVGAEPTACVTYREMGSAGNDEK
jgi:hypothetical protein